LEPDGDTPADTEAAKGLLPCGIRSVRMGRAHAHIRQDARRIREGLIDRRGKRLKPLQVSVGSNNPVKIRAVKDVFQALSLSARVRGVRVKTDVSDQPFDEEAVHGAMNRAKSAIGGGDCGVGIEAGLVWSSAC